MRGGCTISFVDFYRCALRGLRACGARDIALEERQALAQQLQAIADACRLPLRADVKNVLHSFPLATTTSSV